MKAVNNDMNKTFLKHISISLLCGLLLLFVLMFAACEKHPESLISENLIETEYYHTEVELSMEYNIIQESISKFITQPMNYINRIVVLLDPNWMGDLRTFYIIERHEIEYVYSLLMKTQVVNVNQHPAHYQSIQSDLEFIIRLEYINGEMDEIGDFNRLHEEIFRFLDTKGSSGDLGFIVGSNEEIWKFIENLKNH